MAELEEKLNAILGNQEAMGQIMALASSLSGGQQSQTDESPEEGEPMQAVPAAESASDLTSFLDQLDPDMIRKGLSIVRQVREGEDRNAALLNALRPFVREERRGRLDRALEIARMTRMIRAMLGALGKGAGEGV